MTYHAVVCYLDGRPSDHYELGPLLDMHRMTMARHQEGKEPVGCLWDSWTEIWMEGRSMAIRFYPIEDIQAFHAMFRHMNEGTVPEPENA